MSASDPIADMLTAVRNGQLARKPSVNVNHSTVKESIANVLKAEGYISDAIAYEEAGRKYLKIILKYYQNQGVIEKIERVSKPGRRSYAGSDELPKVLGGLGICVVSTTDGMITDKEARKRNMGGELICIVY